MFHLLNLLGICEASWSLVPTHLPTNTEFSSSPLDVWWALFQAKMEKGKSWVYAMRSSWPISQWRSWNRLSGDWIWNPAKSWFHKNGNAEPDFVNGQNGRGGYFLAVRSFNAAFRPLDFRWCQKLARLSRLVIYFLHCITSCSSHSAQQLWYLEG